MFKMSTLLNLANFSFFFTFPAIFLTASSAMSYNCSRVECWHVNTCAIALAPKKINQNWTNRESKKANQWWSSRRKINLSPDIELINRSNGTVTWQPAPSYWNHYLLMVATVSTSCQILYFSASSLRRHQR